MDASLFIDLVPERDVLIDIYAAASIGCDERVRDIIESSESKEIIDERNKKGWTPLMYATSCANLKVVLLLLEEGADTEIKNNEGHTALTLAAKCGSGDVVNLLIDNGAVVNDRDHRGWTALFYACVFGHRSVVQLLIERGAIVDTMDDGERITPLMLAAAAGHEIIVRDLLRLDINVGIECKSGDTAKSLAFKNGHFNVASLIDAQLQSKKNIGSNARSPDLGSLLKELHLTKYYPVFEKHEIDLNTFWLLTDDDLKKIGIQLLGPRKKICMAISQYHQRHSQRNVKENSNVDSVLMENKKLHQNYEKLKTMILLERNAKIAAECNLTDVIRNINNYREMLKSTVGDSINFLEKIKESCNYTRKMFHNTVQSVPFNGNSRLKFKVDSVFQAFDCLQKLVEIQHQNMIAIQQTKCQE